MVERGQQLCFALAGLGVLLDLLPGAAGHVRQRPDDEILEGRVALVEAPPHPAGQRLHLLRRDVVEPLPRQRALAHPADRDDVHMDRAPALPKCRQLRARHCLPATQSVNRLSSACRPTSRCVCRRVYGCAMYASGGAGMSLT